MRALYVGCSEQLCRALRPASAVSGAVSGAVTSAVTNISRGERSAVCAGALLALWLAVSSDAPPANTTLSVADADGGALDTAPSTSRALGALRRRARELAGPTARADLRASCPTWQLTSLETAQQPLAPRSGAVAAASGGAPPPAYRVGYCAMTDDGPSDCERADKGSVPHLPDMAACAAFCQGCRRCRYVSFSASHSDCSWFSHCKGFERWDVLGLEFGGETYLTLQVKARPDPH